MKILSKIHRHGLFGSVRIAITIMLRTIRDLYFRCRFYYVPKYTNPTQDELSAIDQDLHLHNIIVKDFSPNPSGFQMFQGEKWFPIDYHGGRSGGVYDEKLLEHWIADELLGLDEYGAEDIYIDVAAGSSPWVRAQRERRNLNAYAIDLSPASGEYSNLPYYLIENATRSSFKNESVSGVSLQCAYEMFMKEDDTRLIEELARILKPGGKAIILPLYMHTHYCAYSTPEYFGKGFSCPEAKEYVRMGCYGIHSSRKYDAGALNKRVIEPIIKAGMSYRLLALRNKTELGDNIYCHFILELIK